MSNVIQLPYQKTAEIPQDFYDRRELWRQQRGWITRPVPFPATMAERRQIAERQRSTMPPLFAAAMRRA